MPRSDTVFKRILVAVDGSESSSRASKVAMRIAKQNEAELILVSVVQVSQCGTELRRNPSNSDDLRTPLLQNPFDRPIEGRLFAMRMP